LLILSGCSNQAKGDHNSVQSVKDTYPFDVELICPQDYIENGTEVQLQLKLIPSSDVETAIIEFTCFDGIEINIDESVELSDFVVNQEKTYDFTVVLKDTDKGKIQCSIEVFDETNTSLYSFMREAVLISTEDGILCSSSTDYNGLALQHLNNLKAEGRIINSDYDKKKKELMKGGAKIERTIILPTEIPSNSSSDNSIQNNSINNGESTDNNTKNNEINNSVNNTLNNSEKNEQVISQVNIPNSTNGMDNLDTDKNDSNTLASDVGESTKETYPFEIELRYPQDYEIKGREIEIQLVLYPDECSKSALLEFECYDGIELIGDNTIEVNQFSIDKTKTVNFSAFLKDTDKGKIICSINISDEDKKLIYQMKKELYFVKTEDGMICSSYDDYNGIMLRHINNLKSEGRISDLDYEKRKKEIMRGGAEIKTTVSGI
jgi:hypothetical protein